MRGSYDEGGLHRELEHRHSNRSPAQRLCSRVEVSTTNVQRHHGCDPFRGGRPIGAGTNTLHLNKQLRRTHGKFTHDMSRAHKFPPITSSLLKDCPGSFDANFN